MNGTLILDQASQCLTLGSLSIVLDPLEFGTMWVLTARSRRSCSLSTLLSQLDELDLDLCPDDIPQVLCRLETKLPATLLLSMKDSTIHWR